MQLDFLNQDFSYMLGNFMADGSFYKDGRNYRFEFVDGSPYQQELQYSIIHLSRIKKILEVVLGKELPPIKKRGNMFRLVFRSNLLSSLFLKLHIKSGDKSTTIDIPKYYKGSIYEKEFWRGYLDGDGSIARKSKRIAVESMSSFIIDSFAQYLTENNIYFSKYSSQRGELFSHVILIRSISFRDFAGKIGFSHPLKHLLLQEKLKNKDFYVKNSFSLKEFLNKIVDYRSIFGNSVFIVNGREILVRCGDLKYGRPNVPLVNAIYSMKANSFTEEEILKTLSQYRFKKSKGSNSSVLLPSVFTSDVLKIAQFVRLRLGSITFSKAYVESHGEDYENILLLTKNIFDISPRYTCKNEPLFCSGVLRDFFHYILMDKPINTMKNSEKQYGL